MAKKAATADDPVAARVAVLERVRSRRPPDQERVYPSLDGRPPLVTRTPPQVEVPPPADLGQWVDDRILAAFGGRTTLNAGSQCALAIIESCRSGDPAAVRRTAAAAGRDLPADARNLVYQLLEAWRGGAPGFAMDVSLAALTEARRLGWDQRPRRTRRGPEPLSQVPGRVA